MEILVADAIDASAFDPLVAAGHDCRLEPGLTAETLSDAVGDADVVVVRSTKVTAETIAAGSLGLIVRAGAGTDNIDMTAASGRAVYVCNVPGQNAIAVAELTMGLLLAIDRHIAAGTADLREGSWNKARYSDADGIFGSTMAIVGLGEIGLNVAERAAAFGMRVTGLDKPGRSEEHRRRVDDIGVELRADLPSLLGDADVVSIHVPSSPSTVNMVDAEFLALMPDGAVLLNTSRGDIVDESALLEALDARGFRAGLDVFSGEPGSGTGNFASPLASHPSVVGTHHIGASTGQAQRAVADGAVAVIASFAAGEVVNCVNLAEVSPDAGRVVVRHVDRVGLLADVFAVLRARGVNVEEMSNRIFAGGAPAAVATINLSHDPDDALLDELRAIPDVFGVSAIRSPEH